MPDKKLTDAEIVKAKAHFEYGIKCDIFQEPVLSYAKTVLEAFDEINRLQATIEDLNIRLREERNRTDYIGKSYNGIKAEAYKECIEKVEEIICDNTYPDFDVNHKAVNIWKAEAYKDINNLLKELVGEDNGKEKE